jgi:AraC-like DNA-binding protein
VAAAARALGRSTRSLQRELRAAGTSFRAELARARADVAAELLADSELKLETVAARAGFTSPSHFSRFFRRRTGRPPSRSR